MPGGRERRPGAGGQERLTPNALTIRIPHHTYFQEKRDEVFANGFCMAVCVSAIQAIRTATNKTGDVFSTNSYTDIGATDNDVYTYSGDEMARRLARKPVIVKVSALVAGERTRVYVFPTEENIAELEREREAREGHTNIWIRNDIVDLLFSEDPAQREQGVREVTQGLMEYYPNAAREKLQEKPIEVAIDETWVYPYRPHGNF